MKQILPLMLPAIAFAQAPQARTWSNAAILSYVSASGNSSGETIGFANDFTKRWDLMVLTLKGKMTQIESTLLSRTAICNSLDDAVVYASRTSTVTAENYFLDARFDYRLKDRDRWYWYSGLLWEQDIPVGLNSRTAASAGVGRIFFNTGKFSWRADAGFGAEKKIPTILPAGAQKDFVTFNLTSGLRHQFKENINYTADLTCNFNLKEIDDMKTVFKQSLSVAMTNRTALKVGFDMNYRNIPNLISVRAFTANDPPESLGTIAIRAKKLDTLATTSLVVYF